MIGLLLATFAWSKRAWPFLLAAGMFFLLSLDEVAEIHELIGRKIDQYTHFESRPTSVLARTGPWMLVCVPLVLIAIAILAKLTRPYWRTGVAVKFAIGLAVLIGSGAGLELLSNFMTHGLAGKLQVLLEETGEMLGETICLWAAYDLLVAHGIELVKSRD